MPLWGGFGRYRCFMLICCSLRDYFPSWIKPRALPSLDSGLDLYLESVVSFSFTRLCCPLSTGGMSTCE